MRGAITVLFFIFSTASVFSQTQPDIVRNYDSLIAVAFNSGEWDSVVVYSTMAIRAGAETVNIRKSLGYAMFMKHDYTSSALHYRRVFEENKSDQDAIVMLYRCAVLTDQDQEAAYFLDLIPEQTKIWMGVEKSKVFVSADVNSGISLNNNYNLYDKIDIRHGNIYGLQSLNGKLYYLQAGLKIRPFASLSLYGAFTAVQLEKRERISATDLIVVDRVSDVWNGIKYIRNIYQYKDTTYVRNSLVNQHLGYLQANIFFPKICTLKLFGNYLSNEFSTAVSSYKQEQYYAQTVDTFYSARTIYSFTDTSRINYEYIFGAALERNFRKSRIEAGISYSNLNSKIQVQPQIRMVYFPRGNTDLFFTANAVVLFEENQSRLIPQLVITNRVFKKTWLSLSALYGDLSNTTEYDGLVVHNTTDETIYRLSLSAYQEMGAHLSGFFGFNFSRKNSQYIFYPEPDRYITIKTPYSNYLFTVGLKYSL